MDNEFILDMAKRLAEADYAPRFKVKETMIDCFIREFAAPLCVPFGVAQKKSPLVSELDNRMEFLSMVNGFPQHLRDILFQEGRPQYMFPNSDEWMLWIRYNLPKSMSMEDFEAFVHHCDVFAAKWNTRYKTETSLFRGIRMVTGGAAWMLHMLVVGCIWWQISSDNIHQAFWVFCLAVIAMIACMEVSKKK